MWAFSINQAGAQAGGAGAAAGGATGQSGAATGTSGGQAGIPRIPGPPQPNSALTNSGGNSLQNQPGSTPAGSEAAPGPSLRNQRSNFGDSAGDNLRDRVDANRDSRDNLRNDRQDLRQDRQDLRQDRQDLRQDVRQDRRDNEDRSRFVLHNGEWWYWMPDNYWMFYRDNNWSRYDADNFQPTGRIITGYRGPSNNGTYYDENGRQYRRDYAPIRRALRGAAEAAREAQVEVRPGLGNPEVKVGGNSGNTGGTASGTGPDQRR